MAVVVYCLLATVPFPLHGEGSHLQSAVTRAMAGSRGTAVVLAVNSGQILASYRLKVAAQTLASPGSSIKPFTLKALLDTGRVDATTALVCQRPLSIAGHRLDCSHPETGQPLDAATALAYSCNSYFTTMAARLSASQLRESFVKDGFIQTTGLAADEAAGSVALASATDELRLQAIGEWGVRITPLELLRAYRNLALLVSSANDPKLAAIFEGLEGSTSYGMARSAQPQNGVRVAGKTGTASADEGRWTHGWFAGFAPAENPTLVLVVFLEKGRGSDAADVARQIFAALPNTTRTQAGSRP